MRRALAPPRRDIAGRPRRQRVDDSVVSTLVLTLVAGALLTVTTGLAVMLELEQFGPAVGGIIVFKPDTAATERWSVKAAIVDRASHLAVGETGGRHCVLSPGVMAGRGGSLVVEARRLSRPPVYRVHWAGGHTEPCAGRLRDRRRSCAGTHRADAAGERGRWLQQRARG